MDNFRKELKVDPDSIVINLEENNKDEQEMYEKYKKERNERVRKQIEEHRELVQEMRIDKGGYSR